MIPLPANALHIQLGLAGLLGLICSTAGGYLAASSLSGSDGSVRRPEIRKLPPVEISGGFQSGGDVEEARAEAVKLTADLKQKQTEITNLEASRKQATSSLEAAKAAGAAAAQQNPELLSIRQRRDDLSRSLPKWSELRLTTTQQTDLEKAWRSPSESTVVETAVGQLTQVRLAMKSTERATLSKMEAETVERTTQVQTARSQISKIYDDYKQRLDVRHLSDDETRSLLAAITKMMSENRVVKPGENFTNSVGMEMVWVPISGYPSDGLWFGKYEVRFNEFAKILPADSGRCSADGNGLLYRVVWSEADRFCNALTEREHSPSDGVSQTAPSGWSYQLPKSGLWAYARKSADALGLENFDGGVSEFLADTSRSGDHAVFGTSPGADGSRYRDRPVGVPDGNRDLVSVGQSAVVTGSKIFHHEGRVGFRVVLVPSSAQ